MKIGDLVIYKPHASTYEGTGLIHMTRQMYPDGPVIYKISWPAKPAHIGETMTWENPQDFEVINASR